MACGHADQRLLISGHNDNEETVQTASSQDLLQERYRIARNHDQDRCFRRLRNPGRNAGKNIGKQPCGMAQIALVFRLLADALTSISARDKAPKGGRKGNSGMATRAGVTEQDKGGDGHRNRQAREPSERDSSAAVCRRSGAGPRRYISLLWSEISKAADKVGNDGDEDPRVFHTQQKKDRKDTCEIHVCFFAIGS